MGYLDKNNKLMNLGIIFEYPEGIRPVIINKEQQEFIYRLMVSNLRFKLGEILPKQQSEFEIPITLNTDQTDTFKNWLKKVKYLTTDEKEKLSSQLDLLCESTVQWARFRVKVDKNYPLEWYYENIPFGFITHRI